MKMLVLEDFSNPVEEACFNEVVKSLLDLIVLTMLNRTPQHGYMIIKNIHRNFGMLLSPGTLYPFLYSLKEEDLVEIDERKRKKIYSLTSKGKREVFRLHKYYGRGLNSVFSFIDDNLEGLQSKPHHHNF
jgi:DNA-binding PadR family transcriptional regulator